MVPIGWDGVSSSRSLKPLRRGSGCEIAIREVPDSCILLFSKEVNTEISHSDISDIRIIRIPTSGAGEKRGHFRSKEGQQRLSKGPSSLGSLSWVWQASLRSEKGLKSAKSEHLIALTEQASALTPTTIRRIVGNHYPEVGG